MLVDRKDRLMLVERRSAGEERIWVAGKIDRCLWIGKIDRCLWSVDRPVKKGTGCGAWFMDWPVVKLGSWIAGAWFLRKIERRWKREREREW